MSPPPPNLQATGPEATAAMQQQLEAAVAQAVSAAQERVQQFLDAANASRAAAEADVIELRQALAGRDETLTALQQQLAEQQQQQPAAGSSGGSSGGGLQVLQQQVAGLQSEVDGLRRELAAAHQRTHEVTQMYLSAASAAAATTPAATAATGSSGGSSKFLPPPPAGMGRGLAAAAGGSASGVLASSSRGVQSQGPKGLLGLYKRPQVRGLFVMYFVAVHAAVSAIVMRAS